MANKSVLTTLKRAMERFDSWQNAYTGLGTSRDKRTSTVFSANDILGDDYLDMLYHEDGMAARACDTVPEEMLRRGFEIKSDDVDAGVLEEISDSLEELEVLKQFTDGATWARVFGGCLIYIGTNDTVNLEGLSEPLQEESISSINCLHVVDKRHAEPLKWYSDPNEKNFGQPETYMVTFASDGGGVATPLMEIHETRMIRFDGLRASKRYRQQNSGWGLSLIQRMNQVLSQYGETFDSLANLMTDANQGIFRMKNLIDALAANETSLIETRVAAMDMFRSDLRAIVLDADDESFERQNFNWSGIKDPYEIMMLHLSAIARVPVTILMGQSPAGMDATGESDLRWFFDMTESQRNNYMTPKIRQLVRLITLSKDGPTGGVELEKFTVKYPSLWQPTELEEAQIRKVIAESDKMYIESDVLLSEEVAIARFTADGYSTETSIDIEARESILEGDIEELLNPPAPEPPVIPVIPGAPAVEEEVEEEEGE